jgi:hypothetical protein
MKIGEVKDAERKALNELDKWNSVTGFIQPGSSYYYEIQAVIEDAVHIGIQMALTGTVEYDADDNVVKKDKI